MPWAVAAAGVTAVGGIAGSLIQADVSKSGQKAAQQMFAQQRADLAPWRTTGEAAGNVAADLSGANGPDAATAAMKNFQTSPGYAWSLDQGLRSVDAGAAAHGLLRSGAALKAEQTFGTGLADQEFSNYYNRLFNLSTLGENAAAGGASTANAAGNSANSAGNTQASIYGNAVGGVSNTVNSLFSNPKFTDWLSSTSGTSGPAYASLDPTGQSRAPNTWSSQPDSTFLPGGSQYNL